MTVVAERKRVSKPFASQFQQQKMKVTLKATLMLIAIVVILGLGTGLGVKLLGGASTEDIWVEPGADVHEGMEIFDFSNTKIAGSTVLLALAALLATSYFCKKRIVAKLSSGQAPFVPSTPTVPMPAVAYNSGLAQLSQFPDFNQPLHHPFRAGVTKTQKKNQNNFFTLCAFLK